ncbi:MAG: FeoB-associated Cys-rich membrane protein [Clostridia bacterium]|nr:FeoB-associated Cys-rich membrane protein [Clostridia bacterium]
MNIWDILILALIAGAVILAIRVWSGKNKKGGCSCGCGGCTKDCVMRRDEKPKTNN